MGNLWGRPAQARAAGQGGGSIERTDGSLVALSRAQLTWHMDNAPTEVRFCLAKVEAGHTLSADEQAMCRTYLQGIELQ